MSVIEKKSEWIANSADYDQTDYGLHLYIVAKVNTITTMKQKILRRLSADSKKDTFIMINSAEIYEA